MTPKDAFLRRRRRYLVENKKKCLYAIRVVSILKYLPK